MKKVCFLFLAATVAATWAAPPASANGSIAIGLPQDVARNGVAVGLSGDYATPAEAQAEALAQCKNSQVQASTRALCQVVQTFKHQCVSIAMDPGVGTPGFGWGIGGNSTAAGWQALVECREASGDRSSACRVVTTSCDQ